MTRKVWRKRSADLRRLIHYMPHGVAVAGQFRVYCEDVYSQTQDHYVDRWHIYNARAKNVIAIIDFNKDGVACVDMRSKSIYRDQIVNAVMGVKNVKVALVRPVNTKQLQHLRGYFQRNHGSTVEGRAARKAANSIIAAHNSIGKKVKLTDPLYPAARKKVDNGGKATKHRKTDGDSRVSVRSINGLTRRTASSNTG